MALVSVIVPVYNAANTIRECIDSIIAQSFSDFDYVVQRIKGIIAEQYKKGGIAGNKND